MNIPIKVNKDFEKSITSLTEKYGEDFEFLNGFHESQLNFSDFIDGFVDKNVADLSIAKNNYGPLRSVYLMWNPEMLIFSESAYLGELLHRADMNPAYTFRTFMVNEKNMNAYSKAMEAAKGNPDYRQLYIAGGSGSGKTHLMQAIGEYIFQKNTSVRIK